MLQAVPQQTEHALPTLRSAGPSHTQHHPRRHTRPPLVSPLPPAAPPHSRGLLFPTHSAQASLTFPMSPEAAGLSCRRAFALAVSSVENAPPSPSSRLQCRLLREATSPRTLSLSPSPLPLSLPLSFGSDSFLKNIYIYLFGCGMWELRPGLPVLGAQGLSRWTARQVPLF